MLSYRHGFHAGNFADVLKHSVLIEIVSYLAQKNKPFCVIDTHAGSGKYALNSDYALKTREFDDGIGKLWDHPAPPPLVVNYINLQKRFNAPIQGKYPLDYYAGSPLLIKQLIRPQDRLFLFELHSTEIAQLTSYIRPDKRIQLFHADGLEKSLNLLPPPEKRGLVFIDPSYELKTDYHVVVTTIIQMHKRFATGCYALWYPVIERERVQKMEDAFKNSGILNIELFELGICADETTRGMTSSGMIVINPPWTLKNTMEKTLPWLASTLTQDQKLHFRFSTLMPESAVHAQEK